MALIDRPSGRRMAMARWLIALAFFSGIAGISVVAQAASGAKPGKIAVPIPADPQDLVRVALTTTLGTIVLELDSKHAPITTANYLRYVDQKRLDGTVFYRAMKLDFGCKEISRLISNGQDHDLPAPERARVRLHFVICATCRNVSEQMAFLRRAMRVLDPPDAPKE